MSAVAYTSRMALRDAVKSLRGLQLEVYLAIANWPHPTLGPSLQELAAKLERKEGSICGRLNELRAAGCIEDAPLKWGACGKQVKTYRALVWREPARQESGQMALL